MRWLIVGDSYGLPRYHVGSSCVASHECWPKLLETRLLANGYDAEIFLERGLKLAVAKDVMSSSSAGTCIIYAGGIVDFFPRTLPRSIALSGSTYAKLLRRITFSLRKKMHEYGVVYTWTRWDTFESYFKKLAERRCGYLCTLPPIVALHRKNNPNASEFIEMYNRKIRVLAKDISWGLIDVAQFFRAEDGSFHPVDGHFNKIGNYRMFQFVGSCISEL